MTTVTIPKREYTELLKRQERTEAVVRQLAQTIKVLAQDDVELRPEVATRIERRARALDAGKGTMLKNAKEVRDFFDSL